MLWFLLGMSVGTCLGALVVGICRASSAQDDRARDDDAQSHTTERPGEGSQDDSAPRLMRL